MSIDKKGFRYRLSNVITWGGFLGAAVMFFVFISILINLLAGRTVGNWDGLFLAIFLASLPVYLGCALFNYLMVGSFRLLPWRKFDE